jgi:hypothetical protein
MDDASDVDDTVDDGLDVDDTDVDDMVDNASNVDVDDTGDDMVDDTSNVDDADKYEHHHDPIIRIRTIKERYFIILLIGFINRMKQVPSFLTS